MNEIVTSVTTVALAIVGIAILAVLVSKNANTSGVITSGGQAFSGAIGAAVAPITGTSSSFGAGLGNFGS